MVDLEMLRKNAEARAKDGELFTATLIHAAADEIEALRKGVDEMLASQMVQPYRGWNITNLNKAADRARELRGLPSVRELNPDIAAMQDHAAENAAAIRALAGKDEA